MDPAGLALSIAALYTACRDCYSFFTVLRTAEVESSAQLRELEIQQSILKAWGFHWRIESHEASEESTSNHTGSKRTKLHEYLLKNRFKAEGVFSTLSALADTLSNQERLVKRYGIQFEPIQAIHDRSGDNVLLTIVNTKVEDVKPVVSEVKNRLSMLNKFKWAMKDRDNFKKLVAELRLHSDSLYRLCPENAIESMNVYLTLDCLAAQDSPANLKWTSRIAREQAQVDGTSSVRGGYELLASAATLKASVNENRDGGQAGSQDLSTVDEEQPKMLYLGKGLALFERQVVYVEMRDYRGPPLELTSEQKDQIKRREKRIRYLKLERKKQAFYDDQFTDDSSDELDEDDQPIELIRPADPKLRALVGDFVNTFRGSNMRESVYGLDIAGMIDHTEGENRGYCSILYRLPGTIGIQNRERPADNLKLRAPVTLKSLLGVKYQKGIQSTLGARFELARKLVRAVCLLHSSGWLHKNIRAESVMFFPEHVNTLEEDRYELQTEIDVSKPILMGYIFSKPDDILDRTIRPENLDRAGLLPGFQTEQSTEIKPWERPQSQYSRLWDDPRDQKAHMKRRPGTPHTNSIYGRNMLEQGATPEHTKDTNTSGFTLDNYQHPAKHADPTRLYRHAYDVYSLGILLIEVGLWEKLKDYTPTDDEEDHYERRRWICRQYLDRLRWSCGNKYADVVLSCLMIDSTDDEVAKTSQRELCARIVADLEGCQA